MKKNSYTLLLLCVLTSTLLKAQRWIENAAFNGMLPAGFEISQIKTVDDNVVWLLANDFSNNSRKMKVLRTINSGASWQLMTPSTEGGYGSRLEAVDSLTAWVSFSTDSTSRASANKLFKTINGGRTWDIILRGDLASGDVSFFNKNEGVIIYPFSGKHASTDDGGNTWTTISSTTSPFFREASSIASHMPFFKDTIWYKTLSSDYPPTGRRAKLFQSVDKGKTWRELANIPDSKNWSRIDFDFRDNKNGLMLGLDVTNNFKNSNILKTSTGGEQWETLSDLPTNFANTAWGTLRYIPNTADSYIIIASSKDTIVTTYTVNGGKNWAPFEKLSATGFIYSIVSFSSSKVGWLFVINENFTANKLYKWDGSKVLTHSKDITENILLTISPNPSTGIITVQWKNKDNTPPQYLRVTDALGRIVYEKKAFDIGETTETIDLKTVPNGVYFIDYQTGKSRKIEKIYIQH